MRWLAKVALQKGMGALPRSESVNYLFQRHVSRSLPAPDGVFRRKFARASGHFEAFLEHGPRRPAGDAVFYEFGTGWDLAVPLSLWCLGVDRQVLVDVRPNLRFELVSATLERVRRLRSELEEQAGRSLRDPGGAQAGSPEELERRFGIVYRAPQDARATGLESGSIDFVSSTNTLEHIPVAEIVPILSECRRLLRADGALSSRIDLRDHFSYFDRSLSPYSFLRFSDRAWRLVNPGLMFQNRLRRPDYLRAFEESGLAVVAESASRPDEAGLQALRAVELAPRFRDYPPEELAAQSLTLVAKRAERSPDAPQEPEDLRGGSGAWVGLRPSADRRRLGHEG